MQNEPESRNIARGAVRQYNNWLLGFPNVLGCGVGQRTAGGHETGENAVVVFVTHKLPESALRSEDVIPHTLLSPEGPVVTDVVEIAPPRFLLDDNKYRPVVGGCRIMTASGFGTLGGVLYDATDYQPVMLTCNHCVTTLGMRDIIPANNRVWQPTSSNIGRTKRIVPWLPAPLGANYAMQASVDAAVIAPDIDMDVRFEIIDLGKHPYVILPAYVGLEVTKRGYVTETTTGTVKYTDVSVYITDNDGRKVRVGGDGNVFAVQKLGDNFALRGDSGSLVVDEALGAARGMVFGGDTTRSGYTFACELSPIFNILQLETPCMGGLHSQIMRAVRRRPGAYISRGVEGRAAVLDVTSTVDKFRSRYLQVEGAGQVAGMLERALQEMAVPLEESIHQDEDFAGLLDEAFGDWLVLPTMYDMLEYRLPEDFGDRVLRAFNHLSSHQPEMEQLLRSMHVAFSDRGGMKMRDVLNADQR